jgi:hypothetical protein
MKIKFRQHQFIIFLDSPLYLAVVKFQAEHELGRSYAALRIFIEGLKTLNLITQDLYEYYKEKYSQPLKPNFILEDKRPKCVSCSRPATAKVQNIQNGIVQEVCDKHLRDFLESGKWERVV